MTSTRRISALFVVLLLAAGAPAALAAVDLEGRYAVAGVNPGGGSGYDGVVEVFRTGETYRVVWQIGAQSFVGTGILYDGVFSIAYNGGLAVYRPGPGGTLKGQWTLTGEQRLGSETWQKNQ